MAATDRRFNDGNWAAGGLKVLLPDGEECTAESFDVEEGSEFDAVTDELGQPDGGIYTPSLKTGTGTLLITATTIIPQCLQEFIAPFRGATKLWVFTKVGQPRSQKGVRKLSIDFSEVVHPEAYTAPVPV